MAAKEVVASAKSAELELIAEVPGHYGCGTIELAGTGNALYERHLIFDNVVDLADADSPVSSPSRRGEDEHDSSD